MDPLEEGVQFTYPIPERRDRPSWFSFLRDLAQRFSSHATAVNDCYYDFTLGVEYEIKNRRWQGLPIYFKAIDFGFGIDAGAGYHTQAAPHGITGLLMDPTVDIFWNRFEASIYVFGGGGMTWGNRYRIAEPIGASDEFFLAGANVNWRYNYDARLFRAIAYFEYQRS